MLSTTSTRPAAHTCAQVAELYPELAAGASVTVYTSWSRDRAARVVAVRGTIVRAVRNGYVRVLEAPYGCTCDYDPRDLELAPACDMADGCGAAVGEPCEPGCPSLAYDQSHACERCGDPVEDPEDTLCRACEEYNDGRVTL